MKSIGTLWRLAAVVAVATTVCVGEDKAPATDTIPLPKTPVTFKMIKLPPGKITIATADGKQKQYEIKSIWMGQYEVQWPEYDVFWQGLDVEVDRAKTLNRLRDARLRPSTPYEPPDRGWDHDNSPAGSMFAIEAKNYCAWLSKLTGKTYRLPTEAEWEYACRAGGPPVAPKGEALRAVAWYAINSDDRTHESGQKKPNAWGFYDMLGNVAEWVTRDGAPDAVAGGSFRDDAPDVHSGAREEFAPNWQNKEPQDPKGKSWLSNGAHVGFRIVRED